MEFLKIDPESIQPGHPNHWARKAARKHADLAAAIDDFVCLLDEDNQERALREFIEERIDMGIWDETDWAEARARIKARREGMPWTPPS